MNLKMWNKLNLKKRLYLVLTVLFLVTLAGGLVTIWYSFRTEKLITSIIEKNLTTLQTAEDLGVALVSQKGFVSYYFLDDDPEWLMQLEKHRRIFREKLQEARSFATSAEQKETIDLIESEYNKYTAEKDEVISFYQSGAYETGALLHRDVRDRFFNILNLSENYKNIFLKEIMQVRLDSRKEASKLRIMAVFAILIDFFLATFLAYILIKEILMPLGNLMSVVNREGDVEKPDNIVAQLRHGVYDLIEDMGVTRSKLEQSRESLLQSEKMAMVGKLAAGMAHSIRNPFTSVKMRLFSLGRSLELSNEQKEDFDVISHEIRHVDTIVQNFLEFSRPAKLNIQSISPSTVVDMTIRLLQHRLQSYDVKVKVLRRSELPEVQTDPEQLKEVFVNLIVNACEAMVSGGEIVIQEEISFVPQLNRVAVIRVSDNGPGIPEVIQEKIFDHFFTTKEEGTGLGLSIAKRIIEEHNGWLDMISNKGTGTSFVITLPSKE